MRSILFSILFLISCNNKAILISSGKDNIRSQVNLTNSGVYQETRWDSLSSSLTNTDDNIWELPKNSSSDGWVDMSDAILHIDFNEASKLDGGTLSDVSSSGLSGVITTNDLLDKDIKGKFDRGMDFDGDDYVQFATDPKIEVTDFFTIEGWFYSTTNSGTGSGSWKTLVHKDGSGGNFGWYMGRQSDGNKIMFGISTTGSNFIFTTTSDNSFVINEWTHVVGQWDGTTLRVFVNGEEDTEGGFPRAAVGPMFNSTSPIELGKYLATHRFIGRIDEVAFHHSVLSREQIRERYLRMKSSYSGTYESTTQSTDDKFKFDKAKITTTAPYGQELPNNKSKETEFETNNIDMSDNKLLVHMNQSTLTNSPLEVIDSSGEENHGASTNTPEVIEHGQFNNAFKFNGTNQYLSFPDINSSTTFTASIWAWRDSGDDDSSVDSTIFSKWELGADKEWSIGQVDGNLRYRVFVDGVGVNLITTTYFPKSKWVHLALTYDGNTVRGFLDGVEVMNSPAIGNVVDTPSAIEIGRNASSLKHYKGFLDEASYWQRALDINEIKSIYERGALKVSSQVMNCSIQTCLSEVFTAPNQDLNKYFSLSSNTNFLKYKVLLESSDSNLRPQVKSIELTSIKKAP